MNTKSTIIKFVLLIMFLLILIFHVLILIGVVPYINVWGGRLKSTSEMVRFEMFSIILNLFFVGIVLTKSSYLKIKISPKFITIALCSMGIVFVINTIGNLFAKNNFEKYIASPITLILSILCFILARHK